MTLGAELTGQLGSDATAGSGDGDDPARTHKLQLSILIRCRFYKEACEHISLNSRFRLSDKTSNDLSGFSGGENLFEGFQIEVFIRALIPRIITIVKNNERK